MNDKLRRFVRALALALAAVAVALGASACSRYDVLVEKDQAAEARWADVEAQLQRRHDLVPNLVATVKASAAHEEKTLEEVAKARANAASIHLTADDLSDPEKMAAFEKAEGQLSSALSRLLVVQERYPDLKANAAFHDLQVQLEGTENRILRAREQYNEAVRDYNAELNKVGGMVVNKVTGKPFKPRVYFKASAESEAAPQVKF
ncbi:MAG TPA: LemA family protein [Minicystis sp.]|nr:LemA family protein [Minicystis sp.]